MLTQHASLAMKAGLVWYAEGICPTYETDDSQGAENGLKKGDFAMPLRRSGFIVRGTFVGTRVRSPGTLDSLLLLPCKTLPHPPLPPTPLALQSDATPAR